MPGLLSQAVQHTLVFTKNAVLVVTSRRFVLERDIERKKPDAAPDAVVSVLNLWLVVGGEPDGELGTHVEEVVIQVAHRYGVRSSDLLDERLTESAALITFDRSGQTHTAQARDLVLGAVIPRFTIRASDGIARA
jgi:hypothetical protein